MARVADCSPNPAFCEIMLSIELLCALTLPIFVHLTYDDWVYEYLYIYVYISFCVGSSTGAEHVD